MCVPIKEDVRTNKKGCDHQEKTVHRDGPREFGAPLPRETARACQENGSVAQRIHDRKQCAHHQQRIRCQFTERGATGGRQSCQRPFAASPPSTIHFELAFATSFPLLTSSTSHST